MRLSIGFAMALCLTVVACKPNQLPLDLEADVRQARYLASKTSYDVDILTVRTAMLELELNYPVNDRFMNIQQLLRELLFETEAERIIAEMNKTGNSVVVNIQRLLSAISNVRTSLTDVSNVLETNLGALSSSKALFESYIDNFNLTYELGQENINLATYRLVTLLKIELEGYDDPVVYVIERMANEIKDILLTEQGFLDTARLSFNQNKAQLLPALDTIIAQNPTV